MYLPEVVTPPYIYRDCSTRKTFREENFTLGEFTPVNMKICGCHYVSKHREIMNGENYITLDILLKFGSLDKMKITSSEPKYYLVRSRKGLLASLCIRTNVRSKKRKRQGLTLLMSI